MQGLIACCLSIGISKRELFEDYYLDEIREVILEHNRLHTLVEKEKVAEAVYCDDFFGF